MDVTTPVLLPMLIVNSGRVYTFSYVECSALRGRPRSSSPENVSYLSIFPNSLMKYTLLAAS